MSIQTGIFSIHFVKSKVRLSLLGKPLPILIVNDTIGAFKPKSEFFKTFCISVIKSLTPFFKYLTDPTPLFSCCPHSGELVRQSQCSLLGVSREVHTTQPWSCTRTVTLLQDPHHSKTEAAATLPHSSHFRPAWVHALLFPENLHT